MEAIKGNRVTQLGEEILRWKLDPKVAQLLWESTKPETYCLEEVVKILSVLEQSERILKPK